MMGWATRWLALGAGILSLLAHEAHAGDAPWRKLGTAAAGGGLATEVIPIGAVLGKFDRIRIEAAGGSVEVHEVRAYFADGDMQRVAQRIAVPPGQSSEAFELEGSARQLDRVEITCKARSGLGRRMAEVTLWAEPAAHSDADVAQVFDESWELLGKETVGPAVARNVLAIGDFEGRFDAVRLRVLRTDVAFHDIRIVYADGQSDTLAVRKLLRAGDASPPLHLTGESRHIREIELVHEANPDMKGRAVVQVWARRPNR